MSRFKLLLLDANVVIYLHELGLWDKIVEQCDVHLSATVIDESDFYEDTGGMMHRINLRPLIKNGAITEFEVPLEEIMAFRAEFCQAYQDKFDDGETETLAFLFNSKEDYFMCSSDPIVYPVLGSHYRSGQGISLEEMLQAVGLSRQLPYRFTKAYREKLASSGFADGIQGRSRSAE